MTTMNISLAGALSILALLALVAAGLAIYRTASRPRPRDWVQAAMRPTVVVQLKSGGSLKGVMTEVHDTDLVLESAVTFDATGREVTVDGRVIVPAANVSWIQDPGGDA